MIRMTVAGMAATLVVCSVSMALDLGASIGRDGTTIAAVPLETQPLLVSAHCGIWHGQHFILRLKAGYGALLDWENTGTPDGYAAYDRTSLDAVSVQVAPCASVDLPGIPVYLQAGLGCGAHLGWTLGDDDGDRLVKTRIGGLDAAGLLAAGIRVGPRLSLELGMERLLADWSFSQTRFFNYQGLLGYVEQYHTSTTSLNWPGVLEPGYAAGVVLTL
jgi:hypothetical protein